MMFILRHNVINYQFDSKRVGRTFHSAQ